MSEITLQETMVGVGGYGVASRPGESLKTMALGSCVAIILLDPDTRTVGLAHIALPSSSIQPERAVEQPGFFADTAIPALMQAFGQVGGSADPRQFVVKLAGGASVLEHNEHFNIGQRNVEAVLRHLRERGMHIVAREIGGRISRTVTVYVDSGLLRISSPGHEDKFI